VVPVPVAEVVPGVDEVVPVPVAEVVPGVDEVVPVPVVEVVPGVDEVVPDLEADTAEVGDQSEAAQTATEQVAPTPGEAGTGSATETPPDEV
jgi:hypothetical protein